MTVTLYGWGPMFDCPSPSPYVIKTDIQLQLFELDFDRQIADLDAVSKHKAPYVMDGGLLVQDSNFIRAHFEKKLDKPLDGGMSNADRAASWALERMVEGHLLTVMAMERWHEDENFYRGPAMFFAAAPEEVRQQVMDEARAGSRAGWQGQMLRHSREERLQLADWDIQAIAAQLGEKPYLFGEQPTVADASVFGVLVSSATEFFDTPLTQLVRSHASLVDYIDRMTWRFFSENKWPPMG